MHYEVLDSVGYSRGTAVNCNDTDLILCGYIDVNRKLKNFK